MGYTEEMQVAVTVACLAALVATVLSFIFIVPEGRREKLKAFGRFLHDTFNFKYLVVEKILQALYIFLTVFIMVFGLFIISDSISIGIFVLIGGPIILRLVYEILMMWILLVKHVIAIDKKLKDQYHTDALAQESRYTFASAVKEEKAEAQKPASAKPQTGSTPHFCAKCGSPLNADGKCPNCSK